MLKNKSNHKLYNALCGRKRNPNLLSYETLPFAQHNTKDDHKKTGNLFLISCLDVSFYVETIIPFSIGYIFINGNLFCFYWEVIVHLLISHYFFCKR